MPRPELNILYLSINTYHVFIFKLRILKDHVCAFNTQLPTYLFFYRNLGVLKSEVIFSVFKNIFS